MNLLMIRLVISALIVGSILVETRPLGANPLLLLISFDGFRWDYLHMHNLSNFNYLKSRGSHAEYIVNSFSTVTFPNHWTIATGLYEETHGIIENDMYDPVLNKTYNYVTASSQTYEWFGQNRITEPIWTTNQKGGNGRHSAAEWVGANVIFGNQSITYIPYSRANSYYDLIDLFIRLFLDEQKPINFGALYFDEPDHVGHMYGPYSKEMEIKLHELNDVLGYLLDELKKHNLFDRLNLIITSDHGMEKISEDKTIFLDSYIDTSLFDAHGSRACYSIFLKRKSDFDYVYDTLKRIDAIDTYKKEEIPDMLKYKNNVRVGDILIVTKLTYAVYINNETINWTVTNGDHGYYNNESSMYPIFIAHGPAFKQNFESPVFNNVDIYPLMCYILQIIPAINNGSLENVKLMLSDMDHCEYITIFSLLVLTPLLTTASYFRFRKIKKENEENEEKSKCSNSKYSAYIKLPIVTGDKPINALFNNSRLIVDVESEWMKRQIYG